MKNRETSPRKNVAFFSFLSPIVVIPAFFEHFGQFVEFMFRLYMNVIICRQTPPDFLNHYYIHDHYTSTTPKKKVCYSAFDSKEYVWCPPFFKGTPHDRVGRNGTPFPKNPRLLEGPKSKISWRQSLIQTRWRRGSTRNDSHKSLCYT